MTPEPYDFRKPAPLPEALRAPLSAWLLKACQTAGRVLATSLPFPVEMESRGLDIVTCGQMLERVSESSLRFRAPISGVADASLLVLPKPVVLGMLAGLLGEPFDPQTADRELTPLEEDVSDFVAREFFLDPLQQAWALTPKLRLDRPTRHNSAPYTPATLLLVAEFRVRGPFGEQPWWWMLPRAGWLESSGGNARAQSAGPSREEREAFVRALPMRLSVSLGETHMSLVHLAGLEEGDMLLLEQPVDQPLSASLGGQVKYLVWPGALGARQAVSIHSFFEQKP